MEEIVWAFNNLKRKAATGKDGLSAEMTNRNTSSMEVVAWAAEYLLEDGDGSHYLERIHSGPCPKEEREMSMRGR